MVDKHSKEIRSYNMSRIRSKDTKLEEIVRKYLFSRGLRYRKNDKRYPGNPDIVLPKYKTMIFINGCFWHMHEGCSKFVLPKTNTEYWIPKLKRNKQRDSINIKLLEKSGWRVLIIWECEITKDNREKRLETLYKEIVEEPKI